MKSKTDLHTNEIDMPFCRTERISAPFRVERYSDFIITSAKNATLHKMVHNSRNMLGLFPKFLEILS